MIQDGIIVPFIALSMLADRATCPVEDDACLVSGLSSNRPTSRLQPKSLADPNS